MFDIAFTELLVIGLVALIVIGPEKLPKLARTAGTWLGKLNRYVSQVKQDIDRDMKLEELRKLQQEMKDTAQKYEILANQTAEGIRREADEVEGQVSKVMQAMAATDGGLATQEYDKYKAEQAAALASIQAGTSPEPGTPGSESAAGASTLKDNPTSLISPSQPNPGTGPDVPAAPVKADQKTA